jgi:hypothetical protein
LYFKVKRREREVNEERRRRWGRFEFLSSKPKESL